MPPYPPYIDCAKIAPRDFPVIGTDVHGFDLDDDSIARRASNHSSRTTPAKLRAAVERVMRRLGPLIGERAYPQSVVAVSPTAPEDLGGGKS